MRISSAGSAMRPARAATCRKRSAPADNSPSSARQQPRVLRVSGASREIRLLHDDVLPYFDATALEVADEIDVGDGRFWIAIVASGTGSIDGDFGSLPVRRGQTFALPASLPIRVRAGPEAVRVIRCLGPTPNDRHCMTSTVRPATGRHA